MKKWICCILAAALLLSLTTVAYAAEVTTCTVTADTVTAGAGVEVSVPIRIAGKSGFTNFGISLEYDTEKLTLTGIETVAGDISAVNLDKDGSKGCYVTSASAAAVTGDVVLFTAVFTTAADFTGSTQVTPVVSYIRNNTVAFSVFENITATAESGTVEAGTEVLLGDVNGDGKITGMDVTVLKMYMKNKYTLSPTQMKAADVNGDGKITGVDVTMLKMYMKNKLAAFPASNGEEVGP